MSNQTSQTPWKLCINLSKWRADRQWR